MNIITKIFRYIILIVMAPFKGLNHFFKRLEDSSDYQGIVYTVANIIVVVVVILKNGLANGKWISTLLLSLILCSTVSVILTFGMVALILIVEAATNIQADVYDKTKDKIYNADRRTYLKHKEKVDERAARFARSRTEIQEQDAASVSLEYFIERDKNRQLPHIRYIND